MAEWNASLTKVSTPPVIFAEPPLLMGDVLCRACGYLLGPLAQMRLYFHYYFIDDHEFYNRIEEKIFSHVEEHHRTIDTGKALCGNKSCRADLGCITRLKENPTTSPIYPLKCRSIKIRQVNQTTGAEKIILKSKWKDMPFTFPPFQHSSVHHDVFYDALDTLT